MTEKVLVTGASGFIGRQTLLPLMQQGYEVHAVCRNPIKNMSEIFWHTADLHDKEARKALLDKVKPGCILHCAWHAEHGKFWTAEENHLWVSTTKQFVQEAEKAGCKRFVGVGSCAEYDWERNAEHGPWGEGDACRPHTLYGKAKLETFEFLEAFGKEHELSVAWARIFLLFGPYESPKRLVPSVINALIEDEETKCSSGMQVRDFMDTQDVGAALTALLASDVQAAVNVASGTPVSIADVASMLGDIAEKPKLINLGALEDRPDDPPYMVADTTRLLHEVAFIPNANLKARLRQAYEWWCEHGCHQN